MSLERQREIDLPLVGAEECAAKLGPELAAKGRSSSPFRQIKSFILDDHNFCGNKIKCKDLSEAVLET
jgi:hypothetical protein